MDPYERLAAINEEIRRLKVPHRVQKKKQTRQAKEISQAIDKAGNSTENYKKVAARLAAHYDNLDKNQFGDSAFGKSITDEESRFDSDQRLETINEVLGRAMRAIGRVARQAATNVRTNRAMYKQGSMFDAAAGRSPKRSIGGAIRSFSPRNNLRLDKQTQSAVDAGEARFQRDMRSARRRPLKGYHPVTGERLGESRFDQSKIDQEFGAAKKALKDAGIEHDSLQAIGSLDREKNTFKIAQKDMRRAREVLKNFPNAQIKRA